MSNQEWNTMNDMELETMLQDDFFELPPVDVVEKVTPWRRAMNYILWGLALNNITLNFFCLDYILPTVGLVLLILGFQMLRAESKWFRACWALTLITAAYRLPILILNTTIYQDTASTSSVMVFLTAANIVINFSLYFSFWRALVAVKKKSGVAIKTSGAAWLIVWYVMLCILALIQYNGLIIAGILLVVYICIIRGLYKLSKQIQEAGYSIVAAPVKISSRAIVTFVAAFLAVGMSGGYIFGDSYDMDWQPLNESPSEEVETVKAHLVELGFPVAILDDMTDEDILECKDAKKVVVDSREHPFNDGRQVTENVMEEEDGKTVINSYRTTVYDVKELLITGVGVELAGDKEQWKIIQHFHWKEETKFYGTESIQLWPAYRNFDGWYGDRDKISGRVLYDQDDQTYVADYYSLGTETFTSQTVMFGEQTSTDVFAAFSMPNNGDNQRGYVAYTIAEIEDGYIVDGWINYTHQQTWLQYPVLTAKEQRMRNSWNDAGAFLTVQDALQFYPKDGEVNLID